ncbi:G2/M phase-specific E3 ubiquitin-protein ligase, partial [Acropora cervicornis]
MPLKTLDDVKRMVATTAQWFVLGRCKPALEVFRDGLSALGVLGAAKEHPDSLRPLFCDLPEKLTAERMEELFQAKTSPAGSSEAVTESLVLSRGSDFLQDVEDEDIDITLSDILFFTTGCRVLPQCEMPVTIEFLHELPSRFPTANTCSSILRPPVVHQAYESFKADLTFGILNARVRVADLAAKDSVVATAAAHDPDNYLLKVTSDGVIELGEPVTDDYRCSFPRGSSGLKGFFFVRENIIDMSYKLDKKKTPFVPPGSVRHLCWELQKKRNNIYKVALI